MNDTGETRRDRNERANEPTPEFIIPDAGHFLWNIYFRISEAVSRTHDGIYHLIAPSDYEAWFALMDMLVYPNEYDILIAMDRSYCEEANKELEDKRSRQQEEQQRQIDQAKNQRARRGTK